MDTLRTLSSAFLWSFVFTPAFAQTTSLFDATSGSMVLRFTDAFPTFTVAGPGFSYSGEMAVEEQDPLAPAFGIARDPSQSPLQLCPPYDQRRPAVIERNWRRCLH
jgi:hypothetical protein